MLSKIALGLLLVVSLASGRRFQVGTKKVTVLNETATLVPSSLQWNIDPEATHGRPDSFFLNEENTPPAFRKNGGKGDPSVSLIRPWLELFNEGKVPEKPFLYGLKEFTVYSPSMFKYLTFRRENGRPQDIISQLIITVQKGSPTPYSCDSDIRSRIDCALAADQCKSMSNCKAAYGPFMMVQSEATPEYLERILPYPDKPRTQSCTEVGRTIRANWLSVSKAEYSTFKFRSLKGYWCVFTKISSTLQRQIEYAEAYRGKSYDEELAYAGVNADVVPGRVFPFPGASAWTLQAKWAKQHEWSIDGSPILDYEADSTEWKEQFEKLQEKIASVPVGSARVRIYFVGHSSSGDGAHGDGFFGNKNVKADAVSIRAKLESAHYPEVLGEVPVTMSFVACKAASYLCPELSQHMHSFAKLTELYCRIPSVGRYSGGALKKYTAGATHYEHKQNGSKVVFRPGSMNPDAGWDAYDGTRVHL